MAATLRKVPENGAENLYEAIQLFIIMWQVMCLEQTPNPYAFSVGNADRIFEPYRSKEDTGRDMTAALLKHLLVFYNVADRSWAFTEPDHWRKVQYRRGYEQTRLRMRC
mgnify:CR=1 FL=1